ncbi:6295_t:CDS:2, partial [Cetraspora pellucida]
LKNNYDNTISENISQTSYADTSCKEISQNAAIQHVKKNQQFICNIIEKQHKTKYTLTLNSGDLVGCEFKILDKWYSAIELELLGTNEYSALDIISLGTFISLRNAKQLNKQARHFNAMAAIAAKQIVRLRAVHA